MFIGGDLVAMATEPKGTLIPDGGGDPIPLIRDQLTIGRRESCDICMRFANVSNVHCALDFKDGYWFIRDTGSTNGIKVNGMRVQQKVLLPGDRVTIGKKRNFTIHYTLAAGRRALEEIMEDDIMSQSLLERAGLVRPKRDEEPLRRKGKGPAHEPEPDIEWDEQE